jgi:hypothetical protein
MSPSRPGAPAHGLAVLPRGSRPALGAAQIAGICLFPVLGAVLVAVFGLRVGDALLLLGALAAAVADPDGNAPGQGDTAAGR